MCITESGGVHVVFDSEGTSNPLDSPSILYITDIDSETPVQVRWAYWVMSWRVGLL